MPLGNGEEVLRSVPVEHWVDAKTDELVFHPAGARGFQCFPLLHPPCQ
jgi:hypothetical protein